MKNRPTGLTYTKHKENPTSFVKGVTPWNAGLKGMGICKPTPGSIKKGNRISPQTEFKPGDNIDNNNHKWKGEKVGYCGVHTYMRRRLGNAVSCVRCDTLDSKRYVWHNISGLYKRDINDWESLCSKCHRRLHIELKKKELIQI